MENKKGDELNVITDRAQLEIVGKTRQNRTAEEPVKKTLLWKPHRAGEFNDTPQSLNSKHKLTDSTKYLILLIDVLDAVHIPIKRSANANKTPTE